VPGTLEQLLAVGMGGHHRAVAGQGQAQCFGQAVHGIGGEHARARTAGGAGRTLHLGHGFIRHAGVSGHHHGIDQIELFDLDGLCARVEQPGFTGFHGSARDKHHRNIDAHGGHQHAGCDLVAVADAHHGVGTMGVDHVFHTVGNDVATRQRIQHAVMPHGNAVIHRDGVELLGDTAGGFNLAGHQLAQVFQVHVTRYKLGERVDDCNDGFLKVAIFHAGGAPQRACTCHVAAGGGGFGAVNRHGQSDQK
jgi:hypothetical protein